VCVYIYSNSILVLIAYVGLFMVALPASVIWLWLRWKKLAPNQVMHATMMLYGKYLRLGMKSEHLLEVLSGSEEFAASTRIACCARLVELTSSDFVL
jgi:preprotein translocase subunit Sec63